MMGNLNQGFIDEVGFYVINWILRCGSLKIEFAWIKYHYSIKMRTNMELGVSSFFFHD